MITQKAFNTTAQFAHFFSAYGVVLTAGILGGHTGLWISAAVMAAFAAVKEFWYDYKYEDAETRGSSLEDFVFYALGIGAAIAFHLVR